MRQSCFIQSSANCEVRRRILLRRSAGGGSSGQGHGETPESGHTELVIYDQAIDITYVNLPTNFVYLACILDALSRCCIGWPRSRTIDTRLTLGALEQALRTRQGRANLIHHSDRGVQYASSVYVARLEQAGVEISMSGKGNPYDNAKAESFFKSLKREEVYLSNYRSFEEAEANLGRFIEDVYNLKRVHSSLGYLPPAEFETLHS